MYGREEWFLISFGSQHKRLELPVFPDYLSVSCNYVTAHNNDSFESNKFKSFKSLQKTTEFLKLLMPKILHTER